MQMQSTHWYYSPTKNTHCWSANPNMTTDSEIKRVGLHDCAKLRCPVVHAGNKTDYEKE